MKISNLRSLPLVIQSSFRMRFKFDLGSYLSVKFSQTSIIFAPILQNLKKKKNYADKNSGGTESITVFV